jgi:hypothetical protein
MSNFDVDSLWEENLGGASFQKPLIFQNRCLIPSKIITFVESFRHKTNREMLKYKMQKPKCNCLPNKQLLIVNKLIRFNILRFEPEHQNLPFSDKRNF